MSFQDRTELAERLEKTFICAFNENVETHKIVKSGIEATEASIYHSYIRYRKDMSSHFVRYVPDSVLLSLNAGEGDTVLVEFKCAKTGVRRQSFLRSLNAECPEMEPPFGSKEDVYNIEADAYRFYQKLHSIGVCVIVVAYCTWIEQDPLRAQFVQDIAICNEYNPNRGIGSKGSGTHIANANFASFSPMAEFFSQHFQMEETVLREIEKAVGREFGARQ